VSEEPKLHKETVLKEEEPKVKLEVIKVTESEDDVKIV
jgi:hypothetical protein